MPATVSRRPGWISWALTALLTSIAACLSTTIAGPVDADDGLAGISTREPGTEDGRPVETEGVESMVIYGRAQADLGRATTASEGHVGGADLELRPVGRVGELLEVVPGLIATQHSGSGKSNQLFLRGFNLDHGTDFATFFDGVPVNFRSHGHGQGYLDLNFVIPELVESIDFRKGPYRADVGDFASAGASFMKTFDQLPDSIASLTVGEDRFVRGLVAANAPTRVGDVLLAIEAKTFEDPYKLDSDLLHLNAFAKLTRPLGDGLLRISGLGYYAEWNSTDQVPRRAIRSNLIDRLGFIDPDLGGETTRLGATIQWEEDSATPLRLSTFLLFYDFKLWSNFTYQLDDPINGDQFKQRDRRGVWGATAAKDWSRELLGFPLDLTLGTDTRLDWIPDLGLIQTERRKRVSGVRRDEVHEWSGAVYSEARWTPFDWLTWMVGVRGDLFVFDVDPRDGLGQSANNGTEVEGIFSPKASLILRPHPSFELYVNGGGGFHSNDARGVTASIDPKTGEAAQSVDPLSRQWGAEVGARWQPDPRLHLTSTLWFLTSQSELVFVGDAGTTEPQGSSRRHGVELTGFVRPFDWIAFDASYSYARAEFKNAPAGEDRIPGALESVVSAGATLTAGPISGSIRVRHFGAYPLTEANDQRAESTTLVNLGAGYDWRILRFGLTVLNLFDSKDNDIEYFFASRLAGEPAPVEDVHLHPVEPRQVRSTITARF
jgi:hypothetical protein